MPEVSPNDSTERFADADAYQAPRHDPAWRRYLRATYLIIGTISFGGLLVRASVADRWIVLATLFYATPWPLLVVGCAVSVGLTALLRWFAQTSMWCVLLLIAASLCWQTQWFANTPRAERADEVTVMFWNAARRTDMTLAAEFINTQDADIVGLVEAGSAKPQARQFWREHCPKYDVSFLGGGLILLTKGTSGTSTPGDLGHQSFYRWIPVQVRGQELQCVVVDLKSDPYYSRRSVLGNLAGDMETLNDQPVLIMGDFNTPTDSVHFGALRQRHRELFEATGQGYSPTWPHPVPVLTLDQMWANEWIVPLECRRIAPVNSDHQAVWCRIAIQGG
ncbi:MAG: endonuclease/exonuclease/phosphatase family protein [Planctomycetaceae bacterium]|nr:endonuclease/exonuclease/phosphatase family protein [Planctomycetaceae bacterium]